MPKPKSRWCTECASTFHAPQMKRLYERNQKGGFSPTGWICPICHFMISDAIESQDRKARATEIRRFITEDENETPKHPGIDRKYLASEEAKRSKKSTVKDLQDPDQLQAAFNAAGIRAEVEFRK